MKLFFSLFKFFSFYIILNDNINLSNIINDNRILLRRNNKLILDNLIYIESIDDKMSYITSCKIKENAVYITTNTEKSNFKKRLIYKITANNGNYFYDYKIMDIDLGSHNKHALMTLLEINKKQYIVTLSHEGQFELFDYDNANVYYSSFFTILTQNSVMSKNTFTSLKFYNYTDYVLNVYVDKHDYYFLLQKLYYMQYNITKRNKINATQVKVESAFKNSTVTCFEFDIFVECLYTNSQYLYTISIFNISDLNNIYNETIEDNPVTYDELFSKGIYIKNNIGSFIYFTENNYIPTLIFKIFINNENEYQLKDYLDPIKINSKGIFSLGNNYIYNDIIKIDDNNIIYISTKSESTEIYIIMIKLLNDDKNILINYYKIFLNDIYNIKIYKDIIIFTLNNLLGIGMTNYDLDINNNQTYSSFFLIGNYTVGNNFNIPDDFSIFNDENIIKISDIININNNIFGYSCGIKILSLLDEIKNGFYIFSNMQNIKINTNDYINSNDVIKFKINSNIGAKLGNYSIEYIVIVKEEEYDNFITYTNDIEYFPNNNVDYKLYFKPKIFYEQIFYLNFSINKCYNTCQKCSYLGDNNNHHCEVCSTKYPFSYPTQNGNNCLESCPLNYKPNKMNTCEIVNIENNCKKLFYIDENLKVNCIDNNICIDEYPHLDEIINNMCTNCLVKYKNECFLECPQNTCIKQDINLNECIDIRMNIKVINKICFENFENITKNLKDMSDSNIVIENIPNLTVYAYDINKEPNYFIENKLTYIYFESIKETIINKYNLDNDVNIYALIVNSPSKYSNSSINDFDFILLLENGTELDLSVLEDIKVNISIPIINLDLANYNYATIFNEQGYDIYDKNSSFYNDICTPGYIDDNDIILSERKQEIYPNNVTTGKSNCEYKLSDLNNQRFIYECNISDNNNNKNEINSFETEEDKENLKNYILDIINYKILNCSILFYDLNNYRHNKAVIICTSTIFVSFCLFFIFIFRGVKKIRALMYNEIPTNIKIKQLIIQHRNSIKFNNYNKIKDYSGNPIKKKQKIMNSKRKTVTFEPKRAMFNNIKFNNITSSKSIIKINGTRKSYIQKNNSFLFKKTNQMTKKRLTINNKSLISQNLHSSISSNIKKIINDNDIEYDDLPLSMALKLDKRNIFYMFGLKILEKIEILDIFVNKKIKEVLLSKYCLFLLINLTMNALLYSDQIVSHKRHNNGNLDYILVFLLSGFSNILASIIGYYLKLLIGFEEKLLNIKEIKKEIIFLRVFRIILREVIIRVIIFFFIEILIILFCSYYLFIFFTIYHKSQMSMLQNYGVSLLEGWLINFIITFLIIIFRKLGLRCNNIYIYNTSKYLDKNF